MTYDILIVTHLPVFYKVNLYNEIAKNKRIYVVFVGADTKEKRSSDFSSLNRAKFDYTVISKDSFQGRNILLSCFGLALLLCKIQFEKIILGGWDLPEFWLAAFWSHKSKNCLALESTIYESEVGGFKSKLKRLFLSRISTVFASGLLHIELLNKLKFSGEVKKTLGVGIINNVRSTGGKFPLCKKYNGNFLYVGRLSKEKNLINVVKIFTNLPHCHLNVIGVGPDENVLRDVSGCNVTFHGSVKNHELERFFKDNDFLLLPSLKEPWGLVVEEAMNFNVPVVISDRCGSTELIEHGNNGLIFSSKEDSAIESTISSIDQTMFDTLHRGAYYFSIEEKDKIQVNQYIDLI